MECVRNGMRVDLLLFFCFVLTMLLPCHECSWTGSLLVSKAYALLMRASKTSKPLSHQYLCKEITEELPAAQRSSVITLVVYVRRNVVYG